MRCRPWVLIGSTAFVATISGCGGGSPTAPANPVTPTPVPASRTVVLEGSWAFPADWHYEWWFTTTKSGTLDIRVDWALADTAVWVRLAAGNCEEPAIEAGQCPWLLRSVPSTARPQVLTLPNAAAGQYTLLIYNSAKQPQSISYLVGLTE
jgi:hypothetical protein